jgi:P63C domain
MEVASMSKQAEGGKARAKSLTREERGAIAKKGAEARWKGPSGSAIRATHAGVLVLGDKTLACANLPDGRRVISEKTILSALGRGYSGYYSQRDSNLESPSAVLPGYLAPAVLKEHIPDDLIDLLSKPVAYVAPGSGSVSKGVVASALIDICSVWIKARAGGKLRGVQLRTAAQAEAMVMALAKVGIDAIIDEATGYQAERERDELQRLLKAYLSDEALKWIKTFPDEFFSQIYRLRGWNRPLNMNKHTAFMGRIINELVYDRLPEGVMEELRKKNPRDGKTKHLKYKHHQFLTRDVGHPHLKAHLQKVIGLLQASLSWKEFQRLFGRVFFPNAGTAQSLGLDED